MKRYKLILLLLTLGVGSAGAGDFFAIQRVEFHAKAPRKGPAVYREVLKEGPKEEMLKEQVFVPCLEAVIVAQEQTKTAGLFVRVHFYNKDGRLIATVEQPAEAERGKDGKYAMPIFLPKAKPESVFFAVPRAVLAHANWQALVVFGDGQGADARAYPANADWKLDYPEKEMVKNRVRVERKAAMDPVVEHVVKTGNPKAPQLTLFMRPPPGMTDAKEAKGVLAMCLLANNVGDIKRQLQGIEPGKEVGGLMGFAEKHQLVILCWGARSLWDPRKSWDEQSRAVNKEMDETFDDMAAAWGRGVAELAARYGIPDKHFLLWGLSGSAQYSCRLALRKPEYFLAVHVHVPSSFDQPTPEASRILWCLTTGELEAGYERSKRFYAQCRQLGYPMVYKALIGLGHAGDARADAIGLKFYEYALTMRAAREAFDKNPKEPVQRASTPKDESWPPPWPESFRAPAFVGDMVNQEMFPLDQAEMTPAAFRVALPTKEIAETWNAP